MNLTSVGVLARTARDYFEPALKTVNQAVSELKLSRKSVELAKMSG